MQRRRRGLGGGGAAALGGILAVLLFVILDGYTAGTIGFAVVVALTAAAIVVLIPLERARQLAAATALPLAGIVQGDGAQASQALEGTLAVVQERWVRHACLVLAEWAAFEPGGRRLVESAALPTYTRELIWAMAEGARASTTLHHQPLTRRQRSELFLAATAAGLRRKGRRNDAGPALTLVAHGLHLAGRYDASLRISAALFELDPRAKYAYNAACSAARVGRLDEATAWLDLVTESVGRRANAAEDEDLAAVRDTDAFARMLARQRRHQVGDPFRKWLLLRALKRSPRGFVTEPLAAEA